MIKNTQTKLKLTAMFLAVVLLAAAPALANNPPVADAGGDQSVYSGDYVLLDGSAFDPDGDLIVIYYWRMEAKPTGSSARINNTTTAQTFFTADLAGEYVVSLRVSDGMAWSQPDYAVITAADNLPPTAQILADVFSGTAPLLINFDGSQSSDPEAEPMFYQWSFGDGAISYAVSPSHEFVNPGEYTVSLTVMDDRGQTDTDYVAISVTAPNNPPTAAPSALPSSGAAPLDVQYAANAADPDGDPLTYAWDFGDTHTSTEADPEHTYESAGAYEVWLTVSDGELGVSESLLITVDSPVVMSVSSAMVKWTKNNNTIGNVHLEAEFMAPFPAPDDVVAVLVDVIPLFEAPFADFVLTEDDGEIFYKFKDKNLLVKLDLVGGWLKVIAHKLLLADIDNANGVDVELYISGAADVENIVMTEAPGRKLIYTRPE